MSFLAAFSACVAVLALLVCAFVFLKIVAQGHVVVVPLLVPPTLLLVPLVVGAVLLVTLPFASFGFASLASFHGFCRGIRPIAAFLGGVSIPLLRGLPVFAPLLAFAPS